MPTAGGKSAEPGDHSNAPIFGANALDGPGRGRPLIAPVIVALKFPAAAPLPALPHRSDALCFGGTKTVGLLAVYFLVAGMDFENGRGRVLDLLFVDAMSLHESNDRKPRSSRQSSRNVIVAVECHMNYDTDLERPARASSATLWGERSD